MNTVLLFLLVSHLILAGALQQEKTEAELVGELWEGQQVLIEKIYSEADADKAQVETLKNATAQLLEELSIVRSRQAASSAVQAFMALAFLAYLATIAVCYLVKRCRKHQKEVAKAEFELLEAKLQASRSRRRAAAKEKSAPAQNLE